MPRAKTKPRKPANPVTAVSGPLSDLFSRRGQEGLVVLSAVSGIPVSRLDALRLGAEPNLMEQVSLSSLAAFQ